MKTMRKLERTLRTRYFDAVTGFFTAMGAHETNRRDDKQAPPYWLGPSREYEIMTAAGRLHITVYDDWTHTCFADPAAAAKLAWTLNRHSGKWNFHAFIGQQKTLSAAWIDQHVAEVKGAMERVEARAMTEEEFAAFIVEREKRAAYWAAAREAGRQREEATATAL